MNDNNLKIIFFGNHKIGIPTLREVYKKCNLVAVVTNPDKEQGRGRKMLPTDIKLAALELEIPIIEPMNLNDIAFYKTLKQLSPDIFLVFAFKILPSHLLSIPRLGSFNIHPSLLPKYRGAAPINHTIINGDKETGISTFLMEEKVDAGGIILQEKFSLPPDITAGELTDIVSQKAPEIAIKTIELLISGNYQLLPQDITQATKAPKIHKENCEIDFNKPACAVKNFINGVSPDPGAWKMWDGKIIKFLKAKLHSDKSRGIPGEYKIHGKQFIISCNPGEIEILQIQPESKRAMSIEDFINGYRGPKKGRIE
ncbi:MAG: methionyl-tRNA formyltransferase [Candidatus Kapabacteria bacterium]|jgi:methionyl-tRNA formyltransferase|nr:methionyl-tRNA formyltransferase [Candidatus Kapabacteria bacterium]